MRTISGIAAVAVCAATLSGCGAALEQAAQEGSSTSTTAEAQSGGSSKAAPTTTTKPKPKPKPKPTKSKPALTVAQQNARGSARDYLDYSGFSKKGLIEQLKFEGYSTKDIDAALATMKVDWMAEAVESAQDYLDMTSFSRSGLIEQLEFEGYTAKQAAHAADAVGL